jgi:sulfite reductase alpha subunit-like flavoprotein
MTAATQDSLAMSPKPLDDRSIVILYGSETGNSEDIAVELAQMVRRLHFRTIVDEMDNLKLVGHPFCNAAVLV